MDSEHIQPEGVAVGQALRRIRTARGQSQGACAEHLRQCGLPWNRDTVVTLENGRRETITIRDLLGLSMAYDVPLADWFDGPGEIRVSDTVTITRGDLQRAFRGDRLPRNTDVATPAEFGARRGSGRPSNLPHLPTPGFGLGPRPLTEEEKRSLPLARALNMSPEVAHGVAGFLWGRSLQEERDHRIGDKSAITPRSLRAHRGNMTRLLVAEARAALAAAPIAELHGAVIEALDRAETQVRTPSSDDAGSVTDRIDPPAS
ncbi:helix-turn-helix domain-containing protein [Frankia sp. AvcI1]|uniref:helix-turn-helix domain-containing protein n=1 Tax=Frankia sp. AvcI1 TaxID=573496 RepID=UPI0021196E34|nr:helix-turn-helix domain-containing protein [Frankia sp. AvcI1]